MAFHFCCVIIASVQRRAKAIYLIVSHRIVALADGIVGVALDSVDTSVFHLFHNAHMVRQTVLTAVVPVEEDDVSRTGSVPVIFPEAPFLKPVGAGNTAGEFGYYTGRDVVAFVCTP